MAANNAFVTQVINNIARNGYSPTEEEAELLVEQYVGQKSTTLDLEDRTASFAGNKTWQREQEANASLKK